MEDDLDRGCTKVIIEYDDGSREVHEVLGGEVLVVSSKPGTIAHAHLTARGDPGRVAQLLSTAVMKLPEIHMEFLHYLGHDLSIAYPNIFSKVMGG